MSNNSCITIAIIGTGFSGTMTAVHLLRHIRPLPLRLVLIERAAEFGRGLAYAQTHYPYLLNVPASRMSATPSDPDEFLRFARQRRTGTTGEEFLPRALYGEYLQTLLKSAISAADEGVRVERMRGEAVDIQIHAQPAGSTISLSDGRCIDAQRVVLALGTPPPSLPRTVRYDAGSAAMRRDPWSKGKTLHGSDALLIIGSGLTMVDTAKAALDEYPSVKIHAISRHGLLPPSQTTFRPDALNGDAGLLEAARGSTSRLIAAARQLSKEAERRGGDWREVVTMLRHQVPALWSSLSLSERARFLRHARAYWDVHRHRAPTEVLSTLETARTRGQLTIHPGRLLALDSVNNGVRATWIPRGSSNTCSLDFAEAVNCSGPDYDVTHSSDRLWQALVARGLATADNLKLGLRTGLNGALIAKNNVASTVLHYIGPMLRATFWEATAVAELRIHAEALAAALTLSLGTIGVNRA